MSLQTTMDALLAVIRTSDNFNTRNSSKDDPSILAKGNSFNAIIRYGGSKFELAESPNYWAATWTLMVDLWFNRRGEYKQYNVAVQDIVQDIYTTVLSYPTLDNAAGDLTLNPVDVSEPDKGVGDMGNWWTVSIGFYVTERQGIVINE